MHRFRFLILFFSFVLVLHSCSNTEDKFVRINNSHFEVNGKPYYFVGTNFWYGAILASQGEGGDRERLVQELDYLDSIGINNLRILIGADGQDGTLTKVMPTLQKLPGVYNDTIFDGLDFLLAEMGKGRCTLSCILQIAGNGVEAMDNIWNGPDMEWLLYHLKWLEYIY